MEHADKDVWVIQVRGTIDLATIHAWEETIRKTIRRRHAGVVIEVSRLEHISARGLEMLLALAANQSLIEGCLVLVGVRAPLRHAAQLVGLWDLALEASSIRAAVQKVAQHSAVPKAAREPAKDIVHPPRRIARQGGGA